MEVDDEEAENDEYGERVFYCREQKDGQCEQQVQARHDEGTQCSARDIACVSRV